MKGLILFFGLIFFGFLANPAMAQHWEYVNPKPTGSILSDINFADANTGFITGDAGTILKTSDGGNSWTSRYSATSYPLYSISFPTLTEGFITGGLGTILKTTDGGETWVLKPNGGLTSQFKCVDFPSPDTGFISTSDGLVLRSKDGGESWNVIYAGSYGEFSSMRFPSSSRGFAIAGKKLLGSFDGGFTWNEILSAWYSLNALCFADEMTGYLSVTEGSGYISVYKTMDGGNNWQMVYYDFANEIDKLFFTDASHGFGTGQGNSVVKTSDGGITWSTVNYPFQNQPGPLWFTSLNSGYILGDLAN